MKTTKGQFRIQTTEGWKSIEGRYIVTYPFFIHRAEDEKIWKVSHLATGYNIRRVKTLKKGRSLAKALSPFKIFLMPTLETWNRARARMAEKEPEEFQKLMNIVNGEY